MVRQTVLVVEPVLVVEHLALLWLVTVRKTVYVEVCVVLHYSGSRGLTLTVFDSDSKDCVVRRARCTTLAAPLIMLYKHYISVGRQCLDLATWKASQVSSV